MSKVVAFARASYPCEADTDHELSFIRGDVLDIYEIGDDGWWTAALGNNRGLVPQQYIKPVQTLDTLLHFIRLYHSNLNSLLVFYYFLMLIHFRCNNLSTCWYPISLLTDAFH